MRIWEFRFVAREGTVLIPYGSLEEYYSKLTFEKRQDIRDLSLRDVQVPE